MLPSLTIAIVLAACATSQTAQDPKPGRARWLVLDMDANPDRLPGVHPGALFEIDPAAKKMRVVASSPLWKDPNDFWVLDDGSILVDPELRQDVLLSLGTMHGAWRNALKDYDKGLRYLRELLAEFPDTPHRERASAMMDTYTKALEER